MPVSEFTLFRTGCKNSDHIIIAISSGIHDRQENLYNTPCSATNPFHPTINCQNLLSEYTRTYNKYLRHFFKMHPVFVLCILPFALAAPSLNTTIPTTTIISSCPPVGPDVVVIPHEDILLPAIEVPTALIDSPGSRRPSVQKNKGFWDLVRIVAGSISVPPPASRYNSPAPYLPELDLGTTFNAASFPGFDKVRRSFEGPEIDVAPVAATEVLRKGFWSSLFRAITGRRTRPVAAPFDGGSIPLSDWGALRSGKDGLSTDWTTSAAPPSKDTPFSSASLGPPSLPALDLGSPFNMAAFSGLGKRSELDERVIAPVALVGGVLFLGVAVILVGYYLGLRQGKKVRGAESV